MDKLDMQESRELFPDEAWGKSGLSNGTNGGCIWVNTALLDSHGVVGLGDHDKPELGTFVATREEWLPFVASVKDGEFG